MPWTDWQFWVVTVAAVVGVAFIVRPMLPSRTKKSGAACPGCSSGKAAMKPRRAQLTVSAKPSDEQELG